MSERPRSTPNPSSPSEAADPGCAGCNCSDALPVESGCSNGNGNGNGWDWVGFDLDHALCKYNLGEMGALAQRACAYFLVEERGWPNNLRDMFDNLASEDTVWYAKGTTFDVERGNFVVLLKDGGIVAHHGASAVPLTPKQISEAYGDERGGNGHCGCAKY